MKNGQVWGCGDNNKFQVGFHSLQNVQAMTQATLLTNFTISQITASYQSTFALHTNGSLIAFGSNLRGELGLNFTSTMERPTIIPFLPKITFVTSSDSGPIGAQSLSAFAISSTFELYAWGNSFSGNLGLGNLANVIIPQLSPNFSNVTMIRASPRHTIMQTKNGQNSKYFVAGSNTDQTLCINEASTSLVVSSWKAMNGVLDSLELVDFAVGKSTNFFLTNNQLLYVCGHNKDGLLGLGDTENRNVPTLLGGFSAITSIKASSDAALFTSRDKVYSVSNNWGIDYTVPQPAYRFRGEVKSIFSGSATSFVMLKDGSVYVAGPNDWGQGCLGSTSGDLNVLQKFQLVPTLKGLSISTIGVGTQHTVVISNTSDVFVCGRNDKGELGLSIFDYIQVESPIKNVALSGVAVSFYVGSRSNLYLNSENELYFWGMNLISGAAVDVPILFFNPLNRIVQVTLHNSHGFVQLNTSEVFGFGTSSSNNLYNLSTTFVPQKMILPFIPKIFAIGSAGAHSLMISTELEVFGFGRNDNGQVGVGTFSTITAPLLLNITNVTMIATAASSSYMLTTNKTLYAMGTDQNGGLGNGNFGGKISIPTLVSLLSNVVDVRGLQMSGMALNRCNANYSGPTCSDPVCFGISARSQEVCTGGLGKCIAPNVCSCFAPNFGDQCENAEYYWKGILSQIWSSSLGWSTKSENTFLDAIYFPSKNTENVFFASSGSSTVILDQLSTSVTSVKSITFTSAANIVFNICLGTLVIEALNIQNPSAILEIRGGKVRIEQLVSVGTLKFTDSTLVSIKSIQAASVELKNVVSMDVADTAIVGQLSMLNSTINGNSWNTKVSTVSQSNILVTQITVGILQISGSVIQVGTMNTIKSSLLDTVRVSHSRVYFGGETTFINQETFQNSNLWISSVFHDASISRYENSILFMNIGCNATIKSTVTGFGSSWINNGTLHHCGSILIPLINNNYVIISNSSILDSSYDQNPGSTLSVNSTLVVNGPLTISHGFMFCNGNLETPYLKFASRDGYFGLFGSRSLKVLGNAEFATVSTLILNFDVKFNDYMNVTQNLTINGFVLIKVDFSPRIGDKILLGNAQEFTFGKPNVFVLGSAFKTATYASQNGQISLEIGLSFGSVQNPGYKCTYLGNQKILEINNYENQDKTILSYTVPPSSKSMGVGFGSSAGISSSILVKQQDDQIVQYQHGNATNPTILVSQGLKSKSIFDIGPEYYTITILIPTSYLKDQKFVYYGEFDKNVTDMHYFETIPFSILDEKEQDCTNFLQPTRAETNEPGVIGALLAIYAILFVLCLIFWRYRPLNTRGIAPIFTVMFLFFQLALEIRNHFLVPTTQASLCLFYAYSLYPLHILVFLVVYIYFLRYFAIINMNELKSSLFKGQKSNKLHIPIWILKFLSSPWLAIIMSIISYFVLILINTIVLAADGYVCRFRTLVVLKSLLNAELLLVFTLTILAFLFDLIANWRLMIQFKWIEYVFQSDPYYFRFQIIVYIPLMIFCFAVELFQVIATRDFYGIVSYHTATIALNTVMFALLLIVDVVLPIALTIIELIRSCIQKRQPMDHLDLILNDKDLSDMFARFCEKEFAIENLSCLKDIRSFNQTGKPDPKDTYHKYFNGAFSELEVNLPKSICAEIKKRVDENDMKGIYDNVERSVLANLADTYSRFSYSSAYIDFQKKKKNQKELIERL